MGIMDKIGKTVGDKAESVLKEKMGELGGALGAVGKQIQGPAANLLLGALFGRADPDVGFAFYVEIDGIRCAKFREARGLEWRSEVESFYEGGNHRYKVNLVGKGSFSPLVLKKGFFATSGEFFSWFDNVMGRAPVQRVTVSIVSLNPAGEEVGRFNFYGAFMSKYIGPQFNATESSLAFEEIEITYDYFEFVPGSALGGALQTGMAGVGK